MSLVIGLMGTDGIVLATDSRLVSEHDHTSEILDNEIKLFIIKNNIGLMVTSNDLPFTKNLIKLAEKEVFLNVDNASLEFRDRIQKVSEVFTRAYSYYASNHPFQMMVDTGGFDMEFIFAGYSCDNSTRNIILLATSAKKANFILNEKPYCVSGITSVANYWMMKLKDTLYKKENDNVIPIQNTRVLRNIAIMIIDESSRASYKIGGPIQMKILRPNKIEDIRSSDIEMLRTRIRETVTNDNKIFERLQGIE